MDLTLIFHVDLTVNPDVKKHKYLENILTTNNEKDEKSSELNVTGDNKNDRANKKDFL